APKPAKFPARGYEAPKVLEEFGINLIPHTPYSPDLSPTDYHFFRTSNYIHQKVHCL
ncbi:hypothetical protein M514_22074, partial [Trichuris suis]